MNDPRFDPFQGAAGPREEVKVQEAWNAILRNRVLVAGVAVAVVALAALYTWRQQPVYEAQATLRIDEQNTTGQNFLGDLAPVAVGGKKIETEMVVLRSRNIAEPVVDSLGLTVHLMQPKAPRSSVLRPLSVPRDAPVGIYELTHQGSGQYSAAARRGGQGARLPARVRIGTPFQVGGATLALEPDLL